MQEIERKFLVKNPDFLKGKKGFKIVQGYLSDDPQRNVRVRIKGDQAFLTINVPAYSNFIPAFINRTR